MDQILFSDVDGTLLDSNHKVLPNTLIAIKKMQKKDIPFVIISARSPSGIYPILLKNNFNCPIISYSGALILDSNKKVLYHKGMNKDNARKIISFIEERNFDLTWCLYSFDEWVVKDRKDNRIEREERIVEATSIEGDINSITSDEIHKILCICNPDKIFEIEKEIKDNFPNFSIVKSSPILLEIMEKNITKATAIHKLCQLWNISINNTIAFGDNYNDFEMLTTVSKGYLMDNAPNELKKLIKLHTDSNDNDGIYNALKSLSLID